MKTIRLTETEISVLRQGIAAVGWAALAKNHPERLAAASALRKLDAVGKR